MRKAGRRTARLVRRARSASPRHRRRAARALVRLHESRARAYARAILKDADLAEDAVQEAWLDCFRNLNSLREPGAFAYWFRRLVFKQCDRIRRRADFRELQGDPADLEAVAADAGDGWLRGKADTNDPAKIVGDKLERREIRRRLFAIYRRLSRADRRLVRMRFLEERPYQEIAHELGITTDTIKNRIRILRKSVRPAIQSDAGYGLPGAFRALSSARLARLARTSRPVDGGASVPGAAAGYATPFVPVNEPAGDLHQDPLRDFVAPRPPLVHRNPAVLAPTSPQIPGAMPTETIVDPAQNERQTALDLRCSRSIA